MIFDTNTFSAWADGQEEAGRLAVGEALRLPSIVLGEWLYGIRRSRHRSLYERWFAARRSRWVVLDVTESTADHYAAIRGELKVAGRPLPANDVWIAALCREHEQWLASRDAHFDHVKNLRRVVW